MTRTSPALASGVWRPAAKASLAIAGWIAAMLVASQVLSLYYLGLAGTVGLNALLALGLILLTGYAGQFSLATAAFWGVGAYGSALLTVKEGWPALLALAGAAAAAGVVALALGRPIFRLRGHFLAMGTLALNEIFYLLVNNLGFTGGASGFGGIQPLSILGKDFIDPQSQFWLIWAVVGIVLWGSVRIGRGREGRALHALRGHEAAASSCGVNVQWSKTKVFVGSAVIGSIAGSLYAHTLLYVNPPPFDITTSVDILTIVVLGGLWTPWGAVLGAIGIEAIRQWVDGWLPSVFGAGSVGAGETLVIGLLLVLILVLRPGGLASVFRDLYGMVTARRARATESEASARETVPPATAPPATASPDASAIGASTDRALSDDVQAEATPGGEVVLGCRGMTKVFGGVRAVVDVDLELHQREILAVIGPNGAGKSTLQNLLSGNLRPTNGTVSVGSEDLTGRPAHTFAAHGIARTFQTPSLFPGLSGRSNVLVGAHLRGKVGLVRSAVPTIAAIREERRLGRDVDEIMEWLGLRYLANQEATQLSLGQQKLLEVARAVAQRPTVLLLDEPGAGLTRSEKQELAMVLRRLRAEGTSLLLVEHDMEFVMSLADRVHVLDFGKTLAIGTPEEVQQNPDVVDAYLGVAGDEHDPDVDALRKEVVDASDA